MKQLVVLLVAICFAASSLYAADPDSTARGAIIVENYYYAKPGKEAEVLSWRLHVCDIIEKLGCKRGRVLRRLNAGKGDEVDADAPDVVWQVEYPDQESLARDVQKELASAEMKEAIEHMRPLLRKFERRRWKVAEAAR